MKRSYINPFITRWDETICRKWETCRAHGLNSDKAGRSPKLLSVLSTRSYFTLASVARKDILVQLSKTKFVETTV